MDVAIHYPTKVRSAGHDQLECSPRLGQRVSARYHVRWKIALIFDKSEHRPAYHGRTSDLSMTGTGMHTDVNFFTPSPVILLLAPPPLVFGARQAVVEIQARQVYAVYSGDSACFRLGFEFLGFKDDGHRVLKEMLDFHMPKLEARR